MGFFETDHFKLTVATVAELSQPTELAKRQNFAQDVCGDFLVIEKGNLKFQVGARFDDITLNECDAWALHGHTAQRPFKDGIGLLNNLAIPFKTNLTRGHKDAAFHLGFDLLDTQLFLEGVAGIAQEADDHVV